MTYGPTATIANTSGLTGSINCVVASNNLICTASGAVQLAAPGSFDFRLAKEWLAKHRERCK